MSIQIRQKTIDDWYRDCRSFHWNDNDVAYRVIGAGPALLMVHGFPTAGCDWSDIAGELQKHFTLVIPDLLDYGRSLNRSARTWRIHDQADMLGALIAELDIASCHLVIHDVGDTVGQELIARHNENSLGFEIGSAVLMNGGIFPAHHRARPAQKLLLSPLGPLVAKLMSKRKFSATLGEIFGPGTVPDSAGFDALWTLAIGVNGKSSFARRIHYMNDRLEHEARWVGALRETDLRMIMINGVEDPISGGHVCDVIEQEIPAMRVIRLPDIGHFPPLEAPDDCVTHIRAFHGLGEAAVV